MGGWWGSWEVLEGYKFPKLPGMIAEPLTAADKFTEAGGTRPLLK